MNHPLVPYLEGIPDDWSIRQIKNLYDVQLGKMLQNQPVGSDDMAIKYLKAAHVQWEIVRTVALPTMWANESDLKTYEVRQGDLLVCEGGEVGRAAILGPVTEPIIIQNALHRVRPRFGDTRFLMYFLRHLTGAGWFDVLCNKATIAHLTGEKLGAIRMPEPPLSVQRAIADFLDRKTAAIDELIEKKKRLVALLAEKRQALITQAVTKGLDPNVPMKDSGVEWIGRMPTHWILGKLSHLVMIQGGATPAKNQPELWEGSIPWVSPKDMKVDILGGSEDHVSELALSRSSLRMIPAGAILLVVRGMILAHSVPVALTTQPVTLNQDMKALLPSDGILAPFVAHYLRAARDALLARVEESGHGTCCLRTDVWKNLPTLVPPLDEQETICQVINAQTKRFAQLIDKVAKSICFLREYRQALITAAVTGRLDLSATDASTETLDQVEAQTA